MKYIAVIAFLLIFSVSAFALDFDLSGQVYGVTGFDSHLNFQKDSNLDDFYAEGRVRLRIDTIFTPNVKFNAEGQIGGTLGDEWPDDKGVTAGLYHNTDQQKLHARLVYLEWKFPSTFSQIDVGIQQLSLPSATFGNALFEARAAALTYKTSYFNNLDMTAFLARPLKNNNDTTAKTTTVFAAIFEFDWSKLRFEPYFTYAYIEQRADAGLGFVERLRYSYTTALGFAGEVYFTDKLTWKFDALYGDGQNKKVHYYESKGYILATILDYETTFGTPGVFAWYNSGNGSLLKDHDDYGFLPVIATERGFGPTKLGFKGRDIGRRGILSETGVGTAGAGFHIKGMNFVGKLKHDATVAYISGTSRHQGAGAPITEEIPGRVNGASGYMTVEDYAIEFNFDSSLEIFNNFETMLELAYIISGFENSKYSYDAFNAQFGIKYTF